MTLPWNRGGEEDRDPLWVDMLPVVGGSAGTPATDREEAREPVLVAPHRDPGEEAVNLDMPPGFEGARKRGAASDGDAAPASASRGRSSGPERPASSPAPDRTADDRGPAAGRGDDSGPDPGDADAATPGAVSLESVVGGDAGRSSTDAEPATATSGTDASGAGTAGDEAGERAAEADDSAEEARDADDRSDTMPVNGT